MDMNDLYAEKKVLVYMQTSQLAPVGGPRGYIYNLKQELDKLPESNIFFIENGREVINKYKSKIESMRKSKMRDLLIIIKSIIKHFFLLYGLSHKALIDLDQYDAVHFHTTLDMYNVRGSLKKYHGKVILSSHSPTLLSSEIYDSRSTFEKKYFKFIYNNLIKIDQYAFQHADYLVFPCPEAEEPYYNNWTDYKKIKERKEGKFRYVLTGIEPCTAKLSRKDIRSKFNIPNGAFIVCYVGRHNQIKGYDILKRIGKKLLENPNIYILVAGKEAPLKGLEHERWIEVGWTSDPHSLIAASDVFLLPNRETYFDLIMLEVLSLGQIVVASKTGGNRFFEKEQCDGVRLYENEAEAVRNIEYLMKLNKSEIGQIRDNNLKFYNEYFTLEKFANHYIELYGEILKEKCK